MCRMMFIKFPRPVNTSQFYLDVKLFKKWSHENNDGFGFVYDDIIIRNPYSNVNAFIRARPEIYYKYMMLHLRNASMPKDGEHPFRAGHSLVMHNGFIKNYKELAKKYNYALKTGIDSEVLIPILKYVHEDIRAFFERVKVEIPDSKVNLIAINTYTKQYGMLSSGNAYENHLDNMNILASEPVASDSREIPNGKYVIYSLI
jgi:predicted glutamine amidotransferase